MKTFINNILAGVMLLTAIGCEHDLFEKDIAGFDPDSNLPVYEITLTNPGQNAAMTYLDLGSGDIYNYTNATTQPEKIDFIYLWGTTSGANLVSPDNTQRLDEWGSGKNINANWFLKNKTTFVRLAKDAVPTDFYDNVKSMADVRKAYTDLKALVEAQENYNPILHGEGNQLRNIEQGDLLGIKTSKQVYAIVRVQSLTVGNAGRISLTVKVDKSEEKQVEPIAPSEIYSSYEIAVDKLNDLTGKSLLNLTDGTGYTVTEGYYNQHMIDAIFYNEGGQLTVSASGKENIPVLNENVLEIKGDWTKRNKTKFIRLKASADTDQKWNLTYKNSQIKELFDASGKVVEGYDDYTADKYGPSNSVQGIQKGDLILYYSEDKNIYGVIKVSDSGPEFLDAQVKANIHNIREVLPAKLQEITHPGASGANGAGYIDFKKGVIYTTVAEGQQYCADIDLVDALGGSTYHNLIEMTYATGFGAFSATWRDNIASWPTRNASEIYRMGYTAHTWQMYHDLKEDESMWTTFQAEKDNRIVGTGTNDLRRVYPVGDKEIYFIYSKDRKLLIAMKALNTSATSAGPATYRYKIIELD